MIFAPYTAYLYFIGFFRLDMCFSPNFFDLNFPAHTQGLSISRDTLNNSAAYFKINKSLS